MGIFYSKYYQNKTMDNTPIWSLKDKYRYVKILKVYDGDTAWIALRLDGKVYRHKIRLLGIDTPEMKPPMNMPNREEEIRKAKEAKKFLSDLVENKVIKIKCGNWDKYGRLLATLYTNGSCFTSSVDINQLMIDKKLAKAYFGGKKN